MDFETTQALIVGLILWIWCFWFAPQRAWSIGVRLDDPPVGLKKKSFHVLRWVALIIIVGVILPAPPDLEPLQIDVADIPVEMLGGELTGSLLGILMTWGLLWVIPTLIARWRRGNKLPCGEWINPALVFYRWVYLAFIVLACLGYFQEYLPPIYDAFGVPLNIPGAVALSLAGFIIYLVYWVLPIMQQRKDAEAGKPLAIAMQSRVRWQGFPGWVAYKRMDAKGKGLAGKHHILCPACERRIDRYEDYRSLDFESCPHCHTKIPPFLNLLDYIKHHAQKMEKYMDAKKAGEKPTDVYESDIGQRLVRALLTLALRERGTDLHLHIEGDAFQVRCRTDGVMFTLMELTTKLQLPVISAIKVQSEMDITERRKPQDGSFRSNIDGNDIDIRVNTSPTSAGESASLRMLYSNRILGTLDGLGMRPTDQKTVNDIISRPHGLILVTGPTGSGKTTTLYNALGQIADGRRNIITLEDPIEFKLDGITQMEIEPIKGFDFASGLRSIMRQDPDVIMVGEIRDGQTAKMAIDAAMTGHLVFSTLHTINTTVTIGRLLDLGVEPHRHADSLQLILAQRLVRLICRECEETYEVGEEELERLGAVASRKKLILKRGRGCPRCHHTGYYEREGLYELFVPTPKIREMIANQEPILEIRRTARRSGMHSLREDGLMKAQKGRTTIEEVIRVTS